MQNYKAKVKTFSFLLAFLTFHFFLFPSPVSAHVLQSSGSVGAVLHIDPEDDPIVGEPAGFFFEFKDKEGKFKPENCICIFSIVNGGKEIYSQPLFHTSTNPSLTSASVYFTFPQKDVYAIKVVGNPIAAGAFQPFTLSYDIRVAREPKAQSGVEGGQKRDWVSSHVVHLVAAFGILCFVILTIVKGQLRKTKIAESGNRR